MNIFCSINSWNDNEFDKINNFLKTKYKIDINNFSKTKTTKYNFMKNNSIVDSIWTSCCQLCNDYKITAKSSGLKEFTYIDKFQINYDIYLIMDTLKKHIITSTYFTLNCLHNKSDWVNFEIFIKLYYDSNSTINENKSKFIDKIKKNTRDFLNVKSNFTNIIRDIFIKSDSINSTNGILNFDINVNHSLLFLQLIINWRDCPFNPNRETNSIYKFKKFRDYIILLYNQSKLNEDAYSYLSKKGIYIKDNSIITMYIIENLFNYSFTHSLLFHMYIPSITYTFTPDIILITVYRFFYLSYPLNTNIMTIFFNNFPTQHPDFSNLNVGNKYKSIISWQNNIQEFIDFLMNYTLPSLENSFLLLFYKYYNETFKNINIEKKMLTDLEVYINKIYFKEKKNLIDLKFSAPMLRNHDFFSYNTFEKKLLTQNFNQFFNVLLENYKADTEDIIYNNLFKDFKNN